MHAKMAPPNARVADSAATELSKRKLRSRDRAIAHRELQQRAQDHRLRRTLPNPYNTTGKTQCAARSRRVGERRGVDGGTVMSPSVFAKTYFFFSMTCVTLTSGRQSLT